VNPKPLVRPYAALISMTFAFGFSFVSTKFALRGFEPLLIALVRFALAGAILWAIWWLRAERERASRVELARLAALGFVSLTVYFTFENIGIAHTSASEAAILIAAIPIFVNILNVFTLKEHNSVLEWAGIVLSFAGVVLLIQFGNGSGGGTLFGNLLVLAASFSAAVYNVMARRLLVSRSALFVTAFQNIFGALFMLPLAAAEMIIVGVRRPTLPAVLGLGYLTLFCSLLAYLLLNYAFRFVEASKASVFVNLIPVIAVASAFVMLGERFTVGQAAAAVVVIVGVWLTNRGGRASRNPSAG
jgi:drug/metabolite transporter (DMT)-like permease